MARLTTAAMIIAEALPHRLTENTLEKDRIYARQPCPFCRPNSGKFRGSFEATPELPYIQRCLVCDSSRKSALGSKRTFAGLNKLAAPTLKLPHSIQHACVVIVLLCGTDRCVPQYCSRCQDSIGLFSCKPTGSNISQQLRSDGSA